MPVSPGPVIEAWLAARGYRELPTVARFVRDALLAAGVGDLVADAVAGVPRHPFVSPSEWRMAHVPDLERPNLPSPLRLGRALEASTPARGEGLLLVEDRIGWATVACGLLADWAGLSAFSSALAGNDDAEQGALLSKLGVCIGKPVEPNHHTFDVIIVLRPQRDGLAKLLPSLTTRGRLISAPAQGRLQRIARRGDRWALVDLGPTELTGAVT